MSKENQQEIYSLMDTPVIAYIRGLAYVLGGVEPALIISQLLYWQGMGRDENWVYKTVDQPEAETGISPHKQLSAIKKCQKLNVLEVEYKSVPRKRHFWVNIEELKNLITSHPNFGRLDDDKPADYTAEIQTPITKSTSKDYSDSTANITSALVRTDNRLLGIETVFDEFLGGKDGLA